MGIRGEVPETLLKQKSHHSYSKSETMEFNIKMFLWNFDINDSYRIPNFYAIIFEIR